MFRKPTAQVQARGSAWKWPQEVTVSQEHPHPGRLTHLKAGRPAGRASGVQLWLGPGERRGALVSCGRTPRTLGAWGSLRLRVRALVMLAGLRWGVHEPWGCANVVSADVHVSGEGSPCSQQPTKRHELLTTRASQNEPELRPSTQ